MEDSPKEGSLPELPKDPIDLIMEKLNKPTKKEGDKTTSTNNSTSILGEKQSIEDYMAAYGLSDKKKDSKNEG